MTDKELHIGCISYVNYEQLRCTWVISSPTTLIHSETTKFTASRRRAKFRGNAIGLYEALTFIITTLQHYHIPNPKKELVIWMDDSKINALLRGRKNFLTAHQLIDNNESELLRHIKGIGRSFCKKTINQLSAHAKLTSPK